MSETLYARVDDMVGRAMRAWRPPPRLTLSEWADQHFVMSSESSAEPGKWTTLPYQRGIMDAITDPRVEEVSLKKSARIGYTLMISAAIGYYMHQDPSSMLAVQPRVDDAKEFSKETIAPMLRDVPVLSKIVFRDMEERGPKDSSNTLTHKAFPGGILSLAGANSGSGFRRISRRVVIFDEVDAYPASAGNEGDPISLGKKRARSFWNRKIISGSTPLVAGSSRITELFEAGDQRRFYVPCPQCDRMDFFTFRKDNERGHYMQWPEGKPLEAYFVCRANGCVIEHKDKRWMIERGEWRADAPFTGHASFEIWAAYSYSPNDSWGQLAEEFITAKRGGAEKLKTFANTVLGETWQEQGEAPDWLRLFQRREPYALESVPAGVIFLTAGVDVQADRLVWEVVGWGHDKQSWSVACGIFFGDTSGEDVWRQLDDLLSREWKSADGLTYTIHTMAVDSGYNTNTVYNWCRRYPYTRVIAAKGVSTARTLIGGPSAVDVTVRGKRMARGYKVWPVGVDIAKSELYGWLRVGLEMKPGTPFPTGYCHYPEYGEDYFKQLTAEQLVKIRKRTGHTLYEWQVQPGGRTTTSTAACTRARPPPGQAWTDTRRQQRPRPAETRPPPIPRRRWPRPPSPPRRRRQPLTGHGRRGKVGSEGGAVRP
jgi:phage terminase large subunit GpA-like protein